MYRTDKSPFPASYAFVCCCCTQWTSPELTAKALDVLNGIRNQTAREGRPLPVPAVWGEDPTGQTTHKTGSWPWTFHDAALGKLCQNASPADFQLIGLESTATGYAEQVQGHMRAFQDSANLVSERK